MVRDGALRPAEADALLAGVRGASGSGEPATPPRTPTVVDAPVRPPTVVDAPVPDDKTAVFEGSGSYGMTPTEPTPGERGPYRPDAPTMAKDGRPARPLDLSTLGLAGERYEVVEERDGVLRALDRHVERHVELRVPAGRAPDAAYFRHARLLAQLDHPAIQQVHDVGALDGRPYYSLDRAEGTNLADLLRERPALPPLLRAFLTVCDAIEHANDRGIVHGHLTPEQVSLGAFGQVWVTGWEEAWVSEGSDPAVLEAAQGHLAPPAAEGARAHSAPELRRADARPTRRSDVYALGIVLHGILSGGRLPAEGQVVLSRFSGAPRDLRAIARKALRVVPRERYAAAAELRDDVRRFLDGKAVRASGGSPLDALLRLRRRHPVAVGAVATGAALVVLVAAITYRLIDARVDTARGAHVAAQAAAQEATELGRLADAARATAERQAAVTGLLRRFESELGRGLAGGPESERHFAEADRILQEARRNSAADALDQELQARLHRARGDYYLTRADPPEPDRALREFQALARLLPEDAEARFKCFLAARRLPGVDAWRAEQAALSKLEGLKGPFSALGKYTQEVRSLEQRARKLARRTPPVMVPWDPAKDGVYRALVAFAQTRWDVAVAHEMLGRYRAALCCPGIHRRQKVLLEGARVQIEGTRNEYGSSFRDFFRAINLDPLDPVPRVAYLKTFNVKFGLHSPWRYKGGWPLSRLAEAARHARRPEPLIALAEELHKLGRAPSTLPLLERALGLPHARRPRPRTAPTLIRGRLLMARARLHSGLTIDGKLPDVPSELAAEAAVLRAWNTIAAGRTREGVPQLFTALRAGPLTNAALTDLGHALCDDRADPQAVAAALRLAIPPPPRRGAESPVVGTLVLGRAVQLSRLGRASREDFARLRRQRWSPVGWQAGLAALAEAGNLARIDRQHPLAHLFALRLWAELNVDVDSREPQAARAQSLIVKRLEGLGAEAPARAFAGVEDPVRELMVRRLYVAPEVWDWQGRGAHK